MNIPDRTWPHIFPVLLPCHYIRNSRRFQKFLVVSLQKLDADIFQLHLSDQRIDIVVDQAYIPVVGLQRPFILPVERYVFLKQSFQCPAVWNHNFTLKRFVLKLQLPAFCFRKRLECLPFLLSVPVLIHIVVDDLIPAVSFRDRCHSRFLLPPCF